MDTTNSATAERSRWASPAAPDLALSRLVLKARALWGTLLRGGVAGAGELAARGHERVLRHALGAAGLPSPGRPRRHPKGRAAGGPQASRLLRECRRGLPLGWREQGALLGSCWGAHQPRQPAAFRSAPHAFRSVPLSDSALALSAMRGVARSGRVPALLASGGCSSLSLMLRSADLRRRASPFRSPAGRRTHDGSKSRRGPGPGLENPDCRKGRVRCAPRSGRRFGTPGVSDGAAKARISGRSAAAVGDQEPEKTKVHGWLGRQDSNLGMAVPKTAALPLGDAPSGRPCAGNRG